MHNKVVFHAMKALNAFGFPVLRFNFRGVGSSAGEHDYGRGEVADVRVALDYLAGRFSVPILFAGFSFGAAIGLRAAVPHPRVEALIALGIPVNADGREYTYACCGRANSPSYCSAADAMSLQPRRNWSRYLPMPPNPSAWSHPAGRPLFYRPPGGDAQRSEPLGARSDRSSGGFMSRYTSIHLRDARVPPGW